MPEQRDGVRKRRTMDRHHVLGDIHRYELLPVMNGDRVPDELRQDGRASRPGSDHLLLVAGVQDFDLLHKVFVAERPFSQ